MTYTKQKTVLVSPLNWGLGHATRLIPIIELLIKQGYNVIIGAYGGSAKLLKTEFPQCTHINFNGFTPRYSKKHSQTLALTLQSFRFVFSKLKEHQQTAKIISEYNIDIIISDNRYGVRNSSVTSIIITHQLSPLLNKNTGWLRKTVSFFISSWIKKFDHCWIPDITETPNLSGTLSDNIYHLKNIKTIGLLSRFNTCHVNDEYTIENLAIISGPEPLRTTFEQDITNLFKSSSGKSVIVRGLPDDKENEYFSENNITFYNHCNTGLLNELICSSRNIVCRSGYSSLMDLFTTGRRALLVPTPGQPEQEYLARLMVKQHNFNSISQQKLKADNPAAFDYERNFTPFLNNSLPLLTENIL